METDKPTSTPAQKSGWAFFTKKVYAKAKPGASTVLLIVGLLGLVALLALLVANYYLG